ncbi:MAG TPA: nitroreductase/quinone reductase family protein [Methanotrichaceae archaeon]|nr:nitroreductase/quinone reductase family protein [Methanotrichaceae archaeon]
MDEKSLSRALFRRFNRFIVVPAFKIGLGRLISNPLTGQVMVLKVTGRKTGKVRYTPVNYAALDGRIYCYQGKRLKGQWYLNIMANPEVELLMPKGRLSGFAEEVRDPHERADAMRQILKSGGIAGFVYGFNPGTAPDELILDKTGDIPVVRITPA